MVSALMVATWVPDLQGPLPLPCVTSSIGLSSTCEVAVTVLDVNDHSPEFTTAQVSRRGVRGSTEADFTTIPISPDPDREPP